MTTALDIIRRGLNLSNAVGVDQTLTALETSDCLAKFNGMVDSWNADTLAVYNTNYTTFNTTAGQSTYTIGPTGTWVTSRPASLLSPAFCNFGGVDFPMWSMTQEQYNTISLKTQQQQIVERFLYINELTNGIVVLWPVPSAVIPVSFNYQTLLVGPATAATNIAFPPGYEEAFEYGLAVRLAPLFGKAASPDVQQMARETYAAVKKSNRTSPTMFYDSALVTRNAATWQRGY